MNSLVGLDQILALLERLRRVVQTGAHRADQLEREFSLNASRLDRQIDGELKEAEIQLSNAILDLDSAFQSHKERIESSRDRRKTRIVRAHSAVKKRQLKTIESNEGRQIFEVQRELLQTSRDRD